MNMQLKTFEIKGKLVSAKQKVFKVFRLIRGLGKVSSPAPVSYEPTNSLACIHAPIRNYAFEAEFKKAAALAHWRRWDRPK